MQQEASRKLRFTARRTMQVAQQLYEGISIGSEGEVGLITYMRTDSTNVASTALKEASDYIKDKFGAEYAPGSPRTYTTKVKGAQEAHEAIRPTSILRAPENIRQHLNGEQFRLYDLIWKRMLASQMNDALFDSTRVDISAESMKSDNEYLFRATGSVMKFAGFRTVYMEGSDDNAAADEDTAPLPDLADGDALNCLKVTPEQHFTQPPPRFTDATLIRTLEEQGIGRPSTYAPIIATIMDRDYVRKDKGRFVPTQLGLVVTDFLTPNFPDVMNIGFTAKMEEQLDDIADGELEWEPMLKEFYRPFDESIEKTMKEAERVPRESLEEETGESCELCGNPMVIKSGRYGRFMACKGYPECKNTKPVESPEEKAIRELVSEDVDEFCDKCERPMAVKTGRNGRFLACTGYPECKNAKPLPVGVACPDCGNDLVERKQKGKNGRTFYSCSNYPECKFAANPLPQPCPDCGKLLVTRGRGRRNARCLDEACGFTGATPQAEVEEAVA
jgi:DNA topoisomerase-1